MKRAYNYPLLIVIAFITFGSLTLLIAFAVITLYSSAKNMLMRDVPLSEKTNQEVIEEYKPKLMEFRDACQAISKLIAKSRVAPEPVPVEGLDPVTKTISYDTSSPPKANTDIIMYEELKNADTYFSSNLDFKKAFEHENPLNLDLDGQMNQYFKAFDQCTDKADFQTYRDLPLETSDMVPTEKPEPSGKAPKLCVDVLQHGPPKYLGITRVSHYKEPEVIETPNSPGNPFRCIAGKLNYEFYFVDVHSKRILGSFSGSVNNNVSEVPTVSGTSTDAKRDYLRRELDKQLRAAARSDIYAKLAKIIGVDLGKEE